MPLSADALQAALDKGDEKATLLLFQGASPAGTPWNERQSWVPVRRLRRYKFGY